MSGTERDELLRAVRREDERYRDARDKRRLAMLAAVRSGVPVQAVAEAAGVTRDAVYKLVQADRKDDR